MMDSKPIPGNEKEPGFIEVQVNEKGTKFLKKFDNYKEIETALSNSAEKIISKNLSLLSNVCEVNIIFSNLAVFTSGV